MRSAAGPLRVRPGPGRRGRAAACREPQEVAAGRAGMRAGPGRGEEGTAGGRGPGSASPRRLGPGCALPSSPRTAPSPLLPGTG